LQAPLEPVDVVAEKDGKRIAVEIETGKSDLLYNIKKDLEAGFDEVVVICLRKEVKEIIHSLLRETELNNSDKVKLLALEDI
jgi:hypothetical protein